MKYGFIPRHFGLWLRELPKQDLASGLLPLLTSQFLHGGWAHFFGNMWILWLFGDNVEDRLGHFPYLMLYLISGIAASLTHYLFNAQSTVPAIGASGAIAGIMGAYLILFPYAKVVMMIPVLWIPFFFRVPAVTYIGIWFVGQFLLGVGDLILPAQGGGVAWWAHVGGFLFGAIVVRVCIGKPSQRPVYPPYDPYERSRIRERYR